MEQTIILTIRQEVQMDLEAALARRETVFRK